MNINKLGTMLCATVALAIVFIFFGSHLDMDYVIPQRLFRLAAIVLGGICAVSYTHLDVYKRQVLVHFCLVHNNLILMACYPCRVKHG